MGQAHQTPCATNLLQPPEQEAAKTSHFFDLTKHGFYNDLAPGVQRTALRRAYFRGHPLLRCGGWGARLGLWGMMQLAPRGYVERVAELIFNKFNGLYGTKIELVKHRYKENTRRTRTECYPGVLGCR